jgi:hypothetical protein
VYSGTDYTFPVLFQNDKALKHFCADGWQFSRRILEEVWVIVEFAG